MRAASARKRRGEEEDESVFVSMTDMTVSFLFIVILLLAFFASRYSNDDVVPRVSEIGAVPYGKWSIMVTGKIKS
jgi:hypothetical protein